MYRMDDGEDDPASQGNYGAQGDGDNDGSFPLSPAGAAAGSSSYGGATAGSSNPSARFASSSSSASFPRSGGGGAGGAAASGSGSGSGRYGARAAVAAAAGAMLDPDLPGLDPIPEITKLSRAWMEERGAPDLLYWKGDVVDGVIDQIEQQVTILDSLLADPSTSQEEHFRLSLVQLDVERARWLLKAYLRTRLRKIETYAQFISAQAHMRDRLSDVELGYVKKYNELQTAHLNASVLSYLPEKMRGLADDVMGMSGGASGTMVHQPDLDEPAFIRCRVDCGQLRLPDGEMVELAKGSIHLLRYSSVQYLVEQGRVEML
ncbi:GINS complex subunit [Tilletia horrida]|nr:GINS complex subunit [Tilletia horrida]